MRRKCPGCSLDLLESGEHLLLTKCQLALDAVYFSTIKIEKNSDVYNTDNNQRPFGLSRVGQKEIKIYFTKKKGLDAEDHATKNKTT